MSTFLLLVLVQFSSGSYDAKMFQMPSKTACAFESAAIAKQMSKEKGIGYHVSCITFRTTTEKSV